MAGFSPFAQQRSVAPGSIMPVAQRYWVSGQDGIVVRKEMSLESEFVADVDAGAALSVVGFGELPSGKRRARLLHPVKGWCSAKLVSPGATPRYALPARRDGARPRILCLHGGATSGAIFKAQLHAVVQELRDAADFVFADGPVAAPATGPEAKHMRSFFPGLVDGGLFSWMRIVELEAGEEVDVVARLAKSRDAAASGVVHGKGVLVGTKAGDRDQQYRGEGRALAAVIDHVKRWQPDGILGFSQGANVAALLMAAVEAGAAPDVPPPKFLVCMCATHWGWRDDMRARTDAILADAGLRRARAPLFAGKLKIPSLHVVNDDDPRRAFSESFRDDLFEAPAGATCAAGHKPPAEPRFADLIHDFAKPLLEAD